MMKNGIDRFSIVDSDRFFDLLIAEILRIEKGCEKYFDNPFVTDYQKIIASIPRAIRMVQTLPNLSTENPSLISRTIRGSEERAFIQLCHETNKKMMMRNEIYLGDNID